MPRWQVENLGAGDIIKRYGWWYRVLNVQIKGENIGLTIELCSPRPKTKELLVRRGTKFEVKVMNVKPLGGYKKVKVHAIEFKGIANNGQLYEITYCSRNAVDWRKTNERITCAICRRKVK